MQYYLSENEYFNIVFSIFVPMNQLQHKYQNDYLSLEFSDGILLARYRKGIRIDLSIAQHLVEARKLFAGPHTYLFLIEDEGIVSMDKKARDYLSSEEATEGIIATAFVQTSVYSRMLINFFIGVTRHKIKVRAFTDRKSGLIWLKEIENQMQS